MIQKFKTSFFAIITVFSVIISAMPPLAYADGESISGTCGENIIWELNSDGVLTLTGKGAMYNYAYRDYAGEIAPWNKMQQTSNITEVVIGEGITTVGAYAFNNCSQIKKVTLPETMERIENCSFSYCSNMKSINIPNNVNYIGVSAFASDLFLDITVPETVDYVGDNAFYYVPVASKWKEGALYLGKTLYLYKSVSAENENIQIKDGTKRIASNAFINNKSISAVTIPDSVNEIGANAFGGDENLETVTGYKNVNIVGEKAFYKTKWENNLPNGIIYIGNALYKYKQGTDSEDIVIKDGTVNVSNYAFDNTNIKSVTFPSSVKSIGDYSFFRCSLLEKVNFSNGLVSIGMSAFGSCPLIKEVVIPDTVENLSSSAFDNCNAITDFFVGGNINNFENNNILSSKTLVNITVSENNQYFSSKDGVLFNKEKTTLIRYPIAKADTNYTVPDTVTEISNSAFSKVKAIQNVTIPDRVLQIGRYAFNYCENLEYVHMSKSTNTIGEYAFWKCKNLKEIIIPDLVEKIEKYAFWGCSAANKVVIGKNVSQICEYAFYECENLPGVEIPDSVKVMEKGVFSNCSSLKNVTFGTGLTTIADSAFEKCNITGTLVLPENITTLEHAAFIYNGSIKEVKMGNAVNQIDFRVFYGCTNLEKINIPDGVEKLDNTFEGCNSLKEIHIPDSVKELSNTFRFCSLLEKINIPNNMEVCSNAFEYCYSINDVTVGTQNNNYYLENNALIDKRNMQMVLYARKPNTKIYAVPAGVKSFSQAVFYKSDFEKVILPESLQYLGYQVFGKCENLTSITIPKAVKDNIDSYTFTDSMNIKDVYFGGTEQEWKNVYGRSWGNSSIREATVHLNYVPEYSSKTDGEVVTVTASEGADTYVKVFVAGYKNGKMIWSDIKDTFILAPQTEINVKEFEKYAPNDADQVKVFILSNTQPLKPIADKSKIK